jgi:hypothetical protein
LNLQTRFFSFNKKDFFFFLFLLGYRTWKNLVKYMRRVWCLIVLKKCTNVSFFHFFGVTGLLGNWKKGHITYRCNVRFIINGYYEINATCRSRENQLRNK